MARSVAILVCLICVAASGAALANSAEQRLDKAERDIDTLYRAVFQGQPLEPGAAGAPHAAPEATPALAHMATQIADLEMQLRALTGQVEAQGHEIAQLRAALAATPPPTAAARTQAPDAGPQGTYDAAYALVQDGTYAQAETAFRAFLDAYPSDDLAPGAQYWLAESLYARGDYEAAARAFAEGFQRWPNASKAPDNLLKLGMALGHLGRTADACTALDKLRADYPTGAGPVVARADAEAQRLGCTD
jgi:tol-pal system protein YbgF